MMHHKIGFTAQQTDRSSAGVSVAGTKGWVKIIGDSITEGINTGGSNKPDFSGAYTYSVLQALRAKGYEVCVSVCGYSGYLDTGDSTADVPAFYYISGSSNGSGGTYDDTKSRWNKIDRRSSNMLDRHQHLRNSSDGDAFLSSASISKNRQAA